MIDETARDCIAIFRDITGLNHTRSGSSVSDEQILNDPIDSFDVDSLTTMEYIMMLEDRFNLELDEQAVNRCSNIAELAALVSAGRGV
jgi:acyl carrier protein